MQIVVVVVVFEVVKNSYNNSQCRIIGQMVSLPVCMSVDPLVIPELLKILT